MKKMPVLLLCLCMLILCPLACADGRTVTASGACGAQGDNLTWTLYDDGELVIEGEGEMADYSYNSRPGWYDYRSNIKTATVKSGVTSLGNVTFSDCSSLAKVTIADGVTSIGDYAFDSCNSLSNVTIPDGVISIGNSVFCFCSSLKSVTIPESITSIGDSTFYNCNSLTSAGPSGSGCCIEYGWTELIPENAFSSCISLTSVTIPDSVTSIGERAFEYCSFTGAKNYQVF